MGSMVYKDIIDDKIAEWNDNLRKLEQQVANSDADRAKFLQFKSDIDTAIGRLRDLDEQETVGNTLETKDQILGIFSSIDKDFSTYQSVTPFML